ncbi:MAG: integrin alpha, partial [Chthoniobacteraceae bacterium]
SVSAAGDVNGDGFADLIIGAYRANEGGTNRGAAYVVFGFGTGEADVDAKGKTATFTDVDGDLVTIKSSKGGLTAEMFGISQPNALGGSRLVFADLTSFADPSLDGSKITIKAKRGPDGGDGLVNIGSIDARGVALGKVKLDGV